ncbi:MAG: MarR family transcriptional regulator [Methanosarcinales archaeon]
MIELSFIVSGILLIVTTWAILMHYKKIRETYEEYSKAKTVLSDVIYSFNSELKEQEGKIEEISQRIEEFSFRDKGSKEIKEINQKIEDVMSSLNELFKVKENLAGEIRTLNERVDEVFSKYEEHNKKILELEKLSYKSVSEISGAKIESVIPIKRDRAIGRLTDTELKILELLMTEREWTAKEIRDKINLTREHTARLMKSLYMRGYIERSTERVPYRYLTS